MPFVRKKKRSAASKENKGGNSDKLPKFPPPKKERRVLDSLNHRRDSQIPAEKIADRVVALAQVMSEKEFYPYQTVLAHRIVESMLLHEGDTLSALISRQSGKTETIGSIVASILVVLPTLAKENPQDWKLNVTDDKGIYRGYRNGVAVGIYAPRLDQSEIMFNRVKICLESKTGKQILKELNLTFEENNGNTIRMGGSRVLCESASEQSKIEGETHQLLICEESQDISDRKIKKSLHPMVSSTLGTIVKIGTSTNRRCDFYDTIKANERLQAVTGKKYNFSFNYKVCQKYNSMYRKYIEKEKIRLGEDSDEFRMSYGCEWIFERGMFVTQKQLFNPSVAQVGGFFSNTYSNGLPLQYNYYSVVAGIDWGKSHDSTVVTLVAVNWNNPEESGNFFRFDGEHRLTFYKKHIIGWYEFLGDNYEQQFWQIFRLLNEIPQIRKVVTDSNTCGSPIFDRLDSMLSESGIEVVGFNFNPRIKSDGFKSLYSDICGGRITFPASEQVRKTLKYRKFIGQMLDLQKDYKNGLMVVKHPDYKGAHDDYCDSLMLSAWGANIPAESNDIIQSNENFLYR